jgi:hypothetical protein
MNTALKKLDLQIGTTHLVPIIDLACKNEFLSAFLTFNFSEGVDSAVLVFLY